MFYFNGEVWTKDPHIQIELPKDTVVEGQVMEVFSGEGENTTPHCPYSSLTCSITRSSLLCYITFLLPQVAV